MMQHLGFQAIATTSTGLAWSIGRPDYTITIDDVLEHLASLNEKVDIPVNADFESGFAKEPDGVSANVDLVLETGVAGFSIEDRNFEAMDKLYETRLAVERIQAAREAIDHSREDVILVGRTETLLIDPTAVREATDKLIALADAGADCLYAPGVARKEDIAVMVRAVEPKPLNVLVMGPDLKVAELSDLGVRRISVGGGLAQIAWGSVLTAAMKMRDGSFDGFAAGISESELNSVFSKFL
jgi:2-methylisocitrate lyase-like PEP mutase family enzyme